MRAPLAAIAAVACALLSAPPGASALPRFGESVEAGGFELLRDHDDPHLYHPLPAKPRLATDSGGRPRFSLMEFSFRGDDGGTNAGALLNFMLTWGLDEEDEDAVLRALQRRDPEARLSGGLHVREGSYRVVARGGADRWVLAEGRASLLPGQPVAFSRRLDVEETERLQAALVSDDGAIVAGFLFGVEGMGPRVSARCVVDWDAVERRGDAGALGATLQASAASEAEVRAAFDALVSEGAIVVEGIGDGGFEAALGEAYRTFRSEAFETLLAVGSGSAAGGAPLERRYVRRETRHSGRITFAFDGSRAERRELLVTGDITEAVRSLGIGEAREVSSDAE